MDNLNDLKTVHIGHIIKQKLAEKSMSAGELAKRLNCTRTTVYDITNDVSYNIKKYMPCK